MQHHFARRTSSRGNRVFTFFSSFFLSSFLPYDFHRFTSHQTSREKSDQVIRVCSLALLRATQKHFEWDEKHKYSKGEQCCHFILVVSESLKASRTSCSNKYSHLSLLCLPQTDTTATTLSHFILKHDVSSLHSVDMARAALVYHIFRQYVRCMCYSQWLFFYFSFFCIFSCFFSFTSDRSKSICQLFHDLPW